MNHLQQRLTKSGRPQCRFMTYWTVLTVLAAPIGGAVHAGGDFNGDGRDDLVIPIPYEAIGPQEGAGAVQVIYGKSPNGLAAVGSQFWHQDSSGVPGAVGDGSSIWGANFGHVVAIGNFNGDGYDDLAIFARGMLNPQQQFNGMVIVLYGSPSGLAAAGVQAFTTFNLGLEDELVDDAGENEVHFGWELQAGDFNGDGFDELLIGRFFCTARHIDDDGRTFCIVPGSAQGLRRTAASLFSSTNPTVLTQVNDREERTVLETGDFNGDGYDDLALGRPDVSEGMLSWCGEVCVYFGSASGLRVVGMQRWHQDRAGIADVREGSDGFGSTLAAGDFNHDGRDDLAIGVPNEGFDVPIVAQYTYDAGLVHVLYGSSHGLKATGSQLFSQLAVTIATDPRSNEYFGAALQAGDFNGDDVCDLVIGVPGEFNVIAPGVVHYGGGIHVLFGTGNGLRTAHAQFWQRDTPGVIGSGVDGGNFGQVLSAGDYNGDGRADLALGLPSQTINAHPNAGAVHVMYGAGHGLTSIGDQLWHQNVAGIANAAEDYEQVGRYLVQ